MIKVMFYSKMSNIENARHLNYIDYKSCYTMIKHYNSKNNTFVISKNSYENNSKLHGKLFNLNLDINSLIKKLAEIPNIQINKRNKYFLDLIDVFTENEEVIKDVYIIL